MISVLLWFARYSPGYSPMLVGVLARVSLPRWIGVCPSNLTATAWIRQPYFGNGRLLSNWSWTLQVRQAVYYSAVGTDRDLSQPVQSTLPRCAPKVSLFRWPHLLSARV